MRKQRFLMLVISFVLLAAGIFCSAVYHETMIMGLSRIDESEYNQITKTHERMWMDFTLYLNEMELEFVYHDNSVSGIEDIVLRDPIDEAIEKNELLINVLQKLLQKFESTIKEWKDENI